MKRALMAMALMTVATCTAAAPAAVHANSLQQTKKIVAINQHVLSQPYAFVSSDGSNPTTYMPIWYVGRALEAVGYTQSWNGITHTWSLSTGTQGNFSAIPVGSGSARIVINGQLVKEINTYVAVDPGSTNKTQATVYMPIYYIQQILAAAGIPSTWNGTEWSINMNPSKPVIMGFVTNYGNSTVSLADLEAHPQITEFSTFTHAITATGGLDGSLYTAAESYGEQQHLPVDVTVTNTNVAAADFDGNTADAVLNNATASSALLQNIVNLVKNTSFSGVNMDFEMLPTTDRLAYAQFLSTLSQDLHGIGKTMSVDVPAVTNDNSAYDYQAIGQVSDEVIVMAYDYSYPGGPAGPIAPVWWDNQVLAFTTKNIPPNKVLLGIPMYGYDWYGGQTQALSLPEVDNLLATQHITPQWDATDECPYFTYTVGTTTHTVYYENAQSINAKLALVKTYNLRGVSLWHLGLEDSAVWQSLAQMNDE